MCCLRRACGVALVPDPGNYAIGCCTAADEALAHRAAGDCGSTAAADAVEAQRVWKDAYGNTLQDGDSVTLIKVLRIKGTSSVVKVGTKAKNIHLIEGDHDIDCKIDGFGAMQLKSAFIKKARALARPLESAI